jgi:pyridoxal 5'-phosphate synthase pdxT subunit
MSIGVLALQGGVDAHIHALNGQAIPVKKPSELSGLSTLIIPGGETTALLKLMAPLGWMPAIADFHAAGGCLFGTCAGMILLAKHVQPEQKALGLIDIDVKRNAYGRQLDSFIAESVLSSGAALEMVFIRAPKITRVGDGVEVLVSHNNEPVMVRQGRVMVASFHPELSDSSPVYKDLFFQKKD